MLVYKFVVGMMLHSTHEPILFSKPPRVISGGKVSFALVCFPHVEA